MTWSPILSGWRAAHQSIPTVFLQEPVPHCFETLVIDIGVVLAVGYSSSDVNHVCSRQRVEDHLSCPREEEEVFEYASVY